jgi:hypothetical protein
MDHWEGKHFRPAIFSAARPGTADKRGAHPFAHILT